MPILPYRYLLFSSKNIFVYLYHLIKIYLKCFDVEVESRLFIVLQENKQLTPAPDNKNNFLSTRYFPFPSIRMATKSRLFATLFLCSIFLESKAHCVNYRGLVIALVLEVQVLHFILLQDHLAILGPLQLPMTLQKSFKFHIINMLRFLIRVLLKLRLVLGELISLLL